MIWATVSSQSCFYWLNRAFPSLTAKIIINLISVLTIWWCPCVESCVVGRVYLLWPVHSLGKTLLVFVCFILYFKAKFAWCSRYLYSSYFCIPVPCNEMDIFFGSKRPSRRSIQLQLLQHYWSEHRFGLLWYLMVCLGNEQRSFCHFWDCIQVLHFELFCWLWWLLYFF